MNSAKREATGVTATRANGVSVSGQATVNEEPAQPPSNLPRPNTGPPLAHSSENDTNPIGSIRMGFNQLIKDHSFGSSRGSRPNVGRLNSPASPSDSTHSSRLEDPQRRRLSVSTVTREPAMETLQRSHTAARDDISSLSSRSSHMDGTKAPQPSHKSPQPHPSKSVVCKYEDPALELFGGFSDSIREVTISMLLGLLDSQAKSLLIFGSPCRSVQRGFDNKQVDVAGTLASTYDVTENGIGYACKKGLKPESPNQDDFFIVKVDDWALYGVFDGHGPYGHDVSSFIHRVLPYLIIADAKFETDPLFVMRQGFRKAHHLLEALCDVTHNEIDCTLSGTTGTIILHRDNKCYVAHVGDSRSVLSTRRQNKAKAVNLTDDHKPTVEQERKRIEACGGEVRRLEGDIPFRVFIKNRMYPGLAMSRAIGDTVGAAVGVIPDPDVSCFEIQQDDQFLILATDGVWEFISSQEAVDFVYKKTPADVQKAAEFLAYESWRRWVEEEENIVDDVTCVIVWLNPHSTTENEC